MVFSEENFVPQPYIEQIMLNEILINLLLCHTDTINKVCMESIAKFKKQHAETQFWSKFDSAKNWCTLENKVKVTKI